MSAWSASRAVVVASGAILLAVGALVYTPPLDVVVLVFIGPGVLLCATLAAWPRRWLERSAALLVLLPAAAVLFLFGETRWLVDPFRGPLGDYASIVLLALALLLAATGLVAGAPRVRIAPAHVRAFAVSAAVLCIGAIAATGAAGRSASFAAMSYDVEPDARVEVELVDWAFVPDVIQLAPGALTEIVLVNRDDVMHTLSYERDGVVRHHRVLPLDTARLLVRLDAPMQIDAWCAPHPDAMRATLRVEAAPPSPA